MPTQEQKDNVDINIASQGLPNPKEDAKVEKNLDKLAEQPKRDEHGVKKDSDGSSLPADAKVTANNPNPQATKAPTSRFPITPPKPVSQNPAPKASVQNPATFSGGKIGVIDCKVVLNREHMGFVLTLKRNDGVKLQLPFSFLNKQDLYSVKNMFSLLEKMINLPKDKLQEEFMAFILE